MQVWRRCKLNQEFRNFLAFLVNFLHVSIVAVSVSGWVWWPTEDLSWYLAYMVGIGAQWLLSGNHCILTDLEWWLRHNTPWRSDLSEGFIGAWARRVGVNWPPVADRIIPWFVLVLCTFLGWRRMQL